MIIPTLKRCFEMQTSDVNNTIRGYECYDSIANRKKTDVDTQYCPFSITSGEFAWVNEKD